jgi:hypothetical protein
MADDGEYILRRNHLFSRGNHMGQQGFAPNFMQNFRMFGFEACAFASSHNGNGNTLRRFPGFCWHWIQI